MEVRDLGELLNAAALVGEPIHYEVIIEGQPWILSFAPRGGA